MARYGRECSGCSLRVIPIERPFSNFDFIDREFTGLPSLRRIFSQVRMHHAKTMVMEEVAPETCSDLGEENEDLKKRFACPQASRVRRLSFFLKRFSTTRGLVSAREEDFVGYAIIKEDMVSGQEPKRRVFESVIRPSRHKNNFIRGSQRWACRVGGNRYHVCGYLYAQQNNMTNVCAHVACRTAAARYHPDGDMTYREMNDLPAIGIDHRARTSDEGLNSMQMVEILGAAGAHCVVGDYTTPKPGITSPPFHKYLYGSIESGYPAIVCFATASGAYHAVPVFGHTFNEDTWVPSAERSYFRVGADTAYTPSDSWLSTYIAHDDNWGSNFCIPRRFLYTARVCQAMGERPQLCQEQSERVAYVIATFPSSVKVNSIQAEVIGADFLFSMLSQLPPLSEVWDRRLRIYAQHDLLVLRPILTDSREYAAHLGRVTDWAGSTIRKDLIAELKSGPTQRLWMVELSVPELYSANRRKVGEVLIRADAPAGEKRDFRSFLLARVPSYFVLYKGGGASNPQYTFIPSGAHGHVELLGCEDT